MIAPVHCGHSGKRGNPRSELELIWCGLPPLQTTITLTKQFWKTGSELGDMFSIDETFLTPEAIKTAILGTAQPKAPGPSISVCQIELHQARRVRSPSQRALRPVLEVFRHSQRMFACEGQDGAIEPQQGRFQPFPFLPCAIPAAVRHHKCPRRSRDDERDRPTREGPETTNHPLRRFETSSVRQVGVRRLRIHGFRPPLLPSGRASGRGW